MAAPAGAAPAPVVVVGAGLAGSLLALALARRGVATTLVGPAPADGAATGLSYGAMAGRASARAWRELEGQHGPLGLRSSSLLLHGWPPPLGWLPPAFQVLASRAVPLSRVDPRELAAALPAALSVAGVSRRQAMVERIAAQPKGWRLQLAGGGGLEAPRLVLAAGAGCRSLWPELPARLCFSWAGVIEVPSNALPPDPEVPGWLRHARRGGVVQPLRWRRPALEAGATGLEEEAWIVDAGLAPWGEAVLMGQISLVGPQADPLRPPDPARMERRLREGLAALDPRLASLPGRYRQVPVPFCSDGRPLAGPVAPEADLWVFSGFSGAFSAVPPLADQLAEAIAWPQAGPPPATAGTD